MKEAADLIISARNQRKGIDKDSKELINKMIKEGDLNDMDSANCYYLCRTANLILRIKQNDYFDSKQIATIFLKKAEEIANSELDYKNLIKTVIYTDSDEYTGGMNDHAWADQLID